MKNDVKPSDTFLGIHWTTGTWGDFLVYLGLMTLASTFVFAGYLLAKSAIQRKWIRKLNPLEFTLLLSLTIILSGKIQKHFFP